MLNGPWCDRRYGKCAPHMLIRGTLVEEHKGVKECVARNRIALDARTYCGVLIRSLE